MALQKLVREFENVEIRIHAEKYVGQPLNSDVVISAVDSIDARRTIVEAMGKYNIPFYIDSRMGGELMRIYSLHLAKDGTFPTQYFDTLREPEEPAPCTARSILYNILIIAGMIANLTKKYVMEQPVPYEIIFDLNTLTFIKTE